MAKKINGARKKRRWLVWLIEIVIILAIVLGIRSWKQQGTVSGFAPEFDEITLQGQQVSLEDYRGKPVLLHFWASWCGTCELEQSGISRVAENWPVITVAYNSGEVDAVKRYMERKGITDWVTIIDNGGALTEQYGVIGVPASFVIDGNGYIRFRDVGLVSPWGFRLRMWVTDKIFGHRSVQELLGDGVSQQ